MERVIRYIQKHLPDLEDHELENVKDLVENEILRRDYINVE